MALSDFVVIGVVTGRDFQRAGAKFAIDIFISDDWDFAVEHRHQRALADITRVTLVFGVHCQRRIAEDGLRARGRYRDEILRAFESIFEIIERARLLAVIDLQVADGGLKAGGPVDQAWAAIDQAFFIQTHKGFAHRAREAFIQRKTLAFPITGCAQTTQLVGDLAAIFVFPSPGALDERFAPDLLAAAALGSERLFHLQLRGDSGVVGARHP